MILNSRSVIFEIIILILINICYIHTLFFLFESYFEKFRIYKFIDFGKIDKLQLYIFFTYIAVIIQMVPIMFLLFVLFVFSLILLIWFKTKFRVKYFINFIFIFCLVTLSFNIILKLILYIFDVNQVILIKDIENLVYLFLVFKTIIYFIFKLIKSKIEYLNITKIYSLLTSFILIFTIVSVILVYIFLNYENNLFNIILFVCNINLIFILNLIIIITNLNNMQKIVNSVDLNIEYYKNTFSKLKSYIDYIKKFSHDFNNHIIVISSLMDNKKYNDVRLYLEKLNIGEYFKEKNFILSGNHVIDAIVNNKLSKVENLNIKIDTHIYVPVELELDNFDLTIVLGNLIDNAIEAVSRLKEENRYINIFIKYSIRNTLTICIKNTYNSLIDFSKNKTSKKDVENHGIGLINVKEIIDKNNGFFEIKYDKKFFIVRSMFYGV